MEVNSPQGHITVVVAPARPSIHSQRKVHHLANELYALTGAYFITICGAGRKSIFGKMDADSVVPSPLGRLLESRWLVLPEHHPDVKLDLHVVMPNHFHGILFIGMEAGLIEDGSESNLSVIV